METKNGAAASNRNKRSGSKLGRFVTAKRSNVVTDDSSAIDSDPGNAIGNNIEDSSVGNAINGTSNDGDGIESGSRDAGRDGRGSGRGRDGDGSGRSDDNNSADTPRRKRRSSAEVRAEEFVRANNGVTIEEARKIIETTKRPRKVKTFADDIVDGVAGSAILLGGVFEGASALLAMALKTSDFSRDYIKLEKPESQKLGEAVLQVLEAQSKANRKRFDAFMQKIYPYWNLAKVLTEISYPRYELYKMELAYKIELTKQANGNVTREASPITNNNSERVTAPSEDAGYYASENPL